MSQPTSTPDAAAFSKNGIPTHIFASTETIHHQPILHCNNLGKKVQWNPHTKHWVEKSTISSSTYKNLSNLLKPFQNIYDFFLFSFFSETHSTRPFNLLLRCLSLISAAKWQSPFITQVVFRKTAIPQFPSPCQCFHINNFLLHSNATNSVTLI